MIIFRDLVYFYNFFFFYEEISISIDVDTIILYKVEEADVQFLKIHIKFTLPEKPGKIILNFHPY